MADNETASPDRVPGAPHPRETSRIFGQASAEAAFLDAYGADRLHHAWLLTGPKGVGKATLAWRIARFLLATPEAAETDMFGAPVVPTTLDISSEHPVSRRIFAGADPGLQAITRSANEKTNRLRDQIVVDDVRRLAGFFQLSATEGGRRVVIIDAADELNVNAANALLKILDPPLRGRRVRHPANVGQIVARDAIHLDPEAAVCAGNQNLPFDQGRNARHPRHQGHAVCHGVVILDRAGSIAKIVNAGHGQDGHMRMRANDGVHQFGPKSRPHGQCRDQGKNRQGDADQTDPRHDAHATFGPFGTQIAPGNSPFIAGKRRSAGGVM